jgi:lipopolysaccharide/colanic/teichoic acid biosynthesis glycosyltransferase
MVIGSCRKLEETVSRNGWETDPASQYPLFHVDLSYSERLVASVRSLEEALNSPRWMAPPMSLLPDRRVGERAGLGRRQRLRLAKEERLLDLATLKVPTKPVSTVYAAMRRLLDIALTLGGLLALAPLFLVVGTLIKLDGGPIFFSQERVGLGGRRFKMWKFRSMVVNAEALREKLEAQNESGGPTFKMKHDPRITAVGRFIRKYSIDELPQLWNVLKGDMTIVGPRPALPKEVAGYRVWQAQRLAVKPGLTCIWQTSGRSNIKFEDWMRMDVRYIQSQSVTLDVGLITKTVLVVVRGDGAY